MKFRRIPAYLNYYIRLPLLKKFAPKEGGLVYRDLFKDAHTLFGAENPVVVDGGGNQGDWTATILKTFRNPAVYIFEPHPQSFENIAKRFAGQQNVIAVEKALGAQRGKLSFGLADSPASSSFLKHAERSHRTKMGVEKEISVAVTRLDDEVKAVDIIKLDLEGYELEALKGAERVLKGAKVVVTEVEFEHIYEKAPLFEDIALYLRNKGFSLFNIYDTYTQKNGQLTVGDAMFVRDR